MTLLPLHMQKIFWIQVRRSVLHKELRRRASPGRKEDGQAKALMESPIFELAGWLPMRLEFGIVCVGEWREKGKSSRCETMWQYVKAVSSCFLCSKLLRTVPNQLGRHQSTSCLGRRMFSSPFLPAGGQNAGAPLGAFGKGGRRVQSSLSPTISYMSILIQSFISNPFTYIFILIKPLFIL